jgi:hypothetical protein
VSQLMLVNGFLGREGRGSACPCPSGWVARKDPEGIILGIDKPWTVLHAPHNPLSQELQQAPPLTFPLSPSTILPPPTSNPSTGPPLWPWQAASYERHSKCLAILWKRNFHIVLIGCVLGTLFYSRRLAYLTSSNCCYETPRLRIFPT